MLEERLNYLFILTIEKHYYKIVVIRRGDQKVCIQKMWGEGEKYCRGVSEVS
jgi:hypothetical protein